MNFYQAMQLDVSVCKGKIRNAANPSERHKLIAALIVTDILLYCLCAADLQPLHCAVRKSGVGVSDQLLEHRLYRDLRLPRAVIRRGGPVPVCLYVPIRESGWRTSARAPGIRNAAGMPAVRNHFLHQSQEERLRQNVLADRERLFPL